MDMKKKLMITITLAAFAITLPMMAGCSRKKDEGPGSGTEAALIEEEAGGTVTEDGLGHIGNGEDITLKILSPEEDRALIKKMADSFADKYKEDVNIKIELQACPKKDIKKKILSNVELAADLYTFSGSELLPLAEAGALQEVSLNTDKMIEENGGSDSGAVKAGSYDGRLYAYPKAVEDGLLLYYNEKYFEPEDADSLEDMMKIASKKGKKVAMDFTSGLYTWSFFGGAGFELILNSDRSNACNMNRTAASSAKGTDVLQAMLDICKNDGFASMTDKEIIKGMQDETVIAAIEKMSNVNSIKQALEGNYAAAKLPTYNLNGVTMQMSSFTGYQYIGINPYSENVGWAMRYAEWLTNEKNQLERYEAREEMPTNIAAAESDLIQEDMTAASFVTQQNFALINGIQSENFWKPMSELGGLCIAGNQTGEDLQAVLDKAAEQITKPVS